MAADRLRDSMLPNAFSNALFDIADLFQKELQLAKAEFSSKLTHQIARRRLDACGFCAVLARRRDF